MLSGKIRMTTMAYETFEWEPTLCAPKKKTFPANLKDVYGMKDVQLRKEFFRQKAARHQAQADDFNEKADTLDKLNTLANKRRFKLAQKGYKRLDGKTAKALIARGLQDTCDILIVQTKLFCQASKVELQDAHWAPIWVGDMVKGMKDAGFSAQKRTAFYDNIKQYEGDPESIQSEAGLLILETT
jgi:hypothetical protein